MYELIYDMHVRVAEYLELVAALQLQLQLEMVAALQFQLHLEMVAVGDNLHACLTESEPELNEPVELAQRCFTNACCFRLSSYIKFQVLCSSCPLHTSHPKGSSV